ncbi:hypothetical protein [Sphingobium sp. Ant17]|uniref:hypothetical protein n=1 Tax=Sphingobium sp. Ant17 TaxID=1461752 RepID=UPI00126799D1|nr:hypothetical protein [Sphingobium sp. Ant17]
MRNHKVMAGLSLATCLVSPRETLAAINARPALSFESGFETIVQSAGRAAPRSLIAGEALHAAPMTEAQSTPGTATASVEADTDDTTATVIVTRHPVRPTRTRR